MRPAVRRALVAATAAGLWTVVGCTATVTPPRNVAQPATVHLLREAMHTGLVLPPATDGAGFVEFGYGEWEWFARGNDAWYRVFPTVLWPTMGTLGARPFAAADAAGLQRAAWWAELTPLVVEASKVDALRARLEAAMRARDDEVMRRPDLGWTFVPAATSYWFPNTCADVVAAWCEELGCTVSWVPVCTALAGPD
ncbi:MAG: DUF2459 domain-containing protein [Phycisphaerales bacterium]|nr:DUF2459 domain-containing protein [Phycisphaerales bacterium]